MQSFAKFQRRRFNESLKKSFAQIAQSVEQGIENPRVGGSIPPLGTTTIGPVHLDGAFLYLNFASIYPSPTLFNNDQEQQNYRPTFKEQYRYTH